MYPNLFLLFTSVYAKNDWSADIDRGKPQPEKVQDFLSIMLPHLLLNLELIEYFDILGVNRTSIYHSLALEVRPRALECFSFYAAENYHTDIELENSVTDQFSGLIRDREGNVVEKLNADFKHLSGRVVLKNTTEGYFDLCMFIRGQSESVKMEIFFLQMLETEKDDQSEDDHFNDVMNILDEMTEEKFYEKMLDNFKFIIRRSQKLFIEGHRAMQSVRIHGKSDVALMESNSAMITKFSCLQAFVMILTVLVQVLAIKGFFRDVDIEKERI